MTLDQWIRYVCMPALLAGVSVALFFSIREAIRDWRNGEW